MFLRGFLSRLVRNISSASMRRGRVSRGSMMSSTYPRPAAIYGFANFAVYSATFASVAACGSFALVDLLCEQDSHLRPWAHDAISAVGQATLKSPRMCFET
jgi:hypothetical protein